jgi:hypothetical protein
MAPVMKTLHSIETHWNGTPNRQTALVGTEFEPFSQFSGALRALSPSSFQHSPTIFRTARDPICHLALHFQIRTFDQALGNGTHEHTFEMLLLAFGPICFVPFDSNGPRFS